MIKQEDIQFLKELQYELLNQDTVCQADPRFWVVRHSQRMYGIEAGYEDGWELVDRFGNIITKTFEGIIEYIEENGATVSKDEHDFYDVRTSYGPARTLFDTDDAVEFIEENFEDIQIVRYKDVFVNASDTFFLTKRECEEHIKRNSHHYNDDAHTYAMTAWRSPQVERLWNLLQTMEWSELDELCSESKSEKYKGE